MLKYTLSIVFLCCTFFGLAQSPQPVLNAVVSPPPDASSMTKFSSHPVANSSGLPSINIPIYVVKGRQLSLPISIGYHAGGFQVNEIASAVGLGWSLNAGGAVTRVMRGRPDELTNGFLDFAGNIPDETDNITGSQKLDLAENVDDMMPDIFYYSTGSYGGKFMFGNDSLPHQIPQTDFKINADIHGSGNNNEFEVIAPDGTIYSYTLTETMDTEINGPVVPQYTSSWYLTEIISANYTDTITLEYDSYSYSYSTTYQQTRYYYYNVESGAEVTEDQIETEDWSWLQTDITNARFLKTIHFAGGKVEFTTSTGRLDVTGSQKKLDKISVYSKDHLTGSYTLEREFEFDYDYFKSTGYEQASSSEKPKLARLKLESLTEKVGSESLPAYKFYYDETVSGGLPSRESMKQDHWGYNASLSGQNDLFPTTYYNGETIADGGTLAPSFDHTSAFVLDSIISPLGGSTAYDYELNDYYQDASNKKVNAGGLRVHKVKSFESSSASTPASVTTFDYRLPSDTTRSTGKLLGIPSYSEITTGEDSNGKTFDVFMLNGFGSGVHKSSSPVIYEYVTIYREDYDKTASNPDANVEMGKTVYNYDVTGDIGDRGFPFVPVADMSWSRGALNSVTTYKLNTADTSYQLVTSKTNTYTVDESYDVTIKGLKVTFDKIYRCISCADQNSDFDVSNSLDYSKFKYLSQTVTKTFDQDDDSKFVTTTTDYTYGNLDDHHRVTKITKTTADPNIDVEIEMSYPQDYSASDAVGVMRDKNIVGAVIERKVWEVDGSTYTLLGYNKTDYDSTIINSQDVVYPEKAYKQKGLTGEVSQSTFNTTPSNYIEVATTLDKYDDYGHLIESHAEGGEPSSTIYGYNHTLPIASVVNASSDEIAYSSFESVPYGNWSVTNKTESKSVSLSQTNIDDSFSTAIGQVITFNYTLSGSPAEGTLTFINGSTAIVKDLSEGTNSDTVTITSGTWDVELELIMGTDLIASFNYDDYKNSRVAGGKTGAYHYKLESGNSVDKDNIPTGSYLITYWQKGGTVSVSTTGITVNSTTTETADGDGWALVTKDITVSNATNSISITGTCQLDELRLHPKDALMSTTTYDLMTGVTSTCNANNIISYQEYDAFGRPTVSKDHDGNIILHKDYNFRESN